MQAILGVFETFDPASTAWVGDPADDPIHVRYRYDADNPLVQQVEDYLRSAAILEPLSQALGKQLEFVLAKFWVDTKMFLVPHKEQPIGNISAAQIYITDQTYPSLGTVINQDDRQILFQLPYRNNFGYLFDRVEAVMHSKTTETPAGFNRRSMQIFFSYK